MATEVKRLTGQVVGKTEENSQLLQQLTTIEENMAAAQHDAAALEREQSRLKQQVEMMEAEKANLEKKVEEVEKARVSNQALMATEVKRLTGQVVGKTEENSQLLQQLTTIEEKMAAKESDVAALEREKALLKQKVEAMKAEELRLESLLAEMEKAKADNKKLVQGEVKRLTQTVLSSAEDNSQLREQLTEIQDQLHVAKRDAAAIERQQGQMMQQVKAMEAEKLRLEDRATELENAKSYNQTLMAGEVKRLTHKVVTTSAENSQLQEELTTLEGRMAVTERGATALDHERARLQHEVEVLEAEKLQLEDKAAQIEKARSYSQTLMAGEVKRLTEKVVTKSEETSQLLQQLTAIEDDMSAKERAASTVERERSKLKGVVEVLEAEKALLERQAVEMERAKTYNQTLMSGEVKRLTQQVVASSDEKSQLLQQLTAIEDKMAATRLDAAAIDRERARLKEEVASMEADKSKLEKHVAEMEKAKSDSQKLVQGEVKRLTQTVLATSDKNSQLLEQLTTAEGQMDAAQRDAAALRDSEARLKLEIDAVEAERLRLENNLTDMQKLKADNQKLVRSEVTRLTQTVLATSDKNSQLLEQLNTTESQMAAAQRDAAATRDSEARLKLVVDAIEAEKSRLEGRLEQVEKDKSQSQTMMAGEVKRLTTKVVTALDENSVLRQQLAQLRPEVSAAQRVQSVLQQELAATEAERAAFENKALDAEQAKVQSERLVQREVASLTQKFVAVSNENAELRQQLTKLEDRMAVTELMNLSSEGTKLSSPEPVKQSEPVKQWLAELQLEQYLPTFVEQGYDCMTILRNADTAAFLDLIIDCGMPQGHAKFLWRQWQLLKSGQPSEALGEGEHERVTASGSP